MGNEKQNPDALNGRLVEVFQLLLNFQFLTENAHPRCGEKRAIKQMKSNILPTILSSPNKLSQNVDEGMEREVEARVVGAEICSGQGSAREMQRAKGFTHLSSIEKILLAQEQKQKQGPEKEGEKLVTNDGSMELMDVASNSSYLAFAGGNGEGHNEIPNAIVLVEYLISLSNSLPRADEYHF
ncbi:hypothetical protein NE237_019344 [Protea cynaroides]|uniref:Uncharacterized protein n=1 Tax=Protea cynaroides TaxID=273540 RepID=A0A9Q0QPS5_9MAGN|nr:hypothetical protein NE237_019344 [Protea cynaroides]